MERRRGTPGRRASIPAPGAHEDAVLVALLDALRGGGWVDGTRLARDLGVPSGAIGPCIERLRREWLIGIEQEGAGYRLQRSLDRLSAAEVRTRLATPWDGTLGLRVAACVGSTNDELVDADPGNDPQALLAERQSRGRGRRGHAWVSPFGANLYLSLAWSFPAQPERMTLLPLMVAVCCTRALHACGMPEVRIKWPNDLYVGERKLGGILVERARGLGSACRVVVGVGVNVSMTVAQAAAVPSPWITLEQVMAGRHTAVPSRNLLAADLASRIADGLASFGRKGFDPFAADWATWDLTRDRRVTVFEEGRAWEGTAQGIDADGALRVDTGTRIRAVHAADVSLRL